MKNIKMSRTVSKVGVFLTGILLFLFLTQVGCKIKPSGEEKEPTNDQIFGLETQSIATVNGKEVSIEQFNKMYSKRRDFITEKYKEISEYFALQLKKSIASELIDTQLIYEESEKRGITITEDVLQKAIVLEQKKYPDKQEFDRYMENLPGGAEQFMEIIRLHLLKEQLTGIDPAEQISPEDIERFYNENRYRFNRDATLSIQEMEIPVTGNEDEAKTKISELHKKITEQNISFSFLARNNSKAPSAKTGGYRSGITQANIDAGLWNALQRLKEGQVSPVVKSGTSYFIVKLVKKNLPVKKSLNEAKDEIIRIINTRRQNARMGEMIVSLRSQYKIKNNILIRYEKALQKFKPGEGSSSASACEPCEKNKDKLSDVKENKDRSVKAR